MQRGPAGRGVDALSDGRAVLGVGLGDTGESVGVDASFTAFAEELDARARGTMLDEALKIVAGLWTGEPFSFHGAHYSIDEVTALPVPPQRPRPSIWVGGGYPSRRPVERALRWDGSCLYRQADKGEFVLMSPEDVRNLRARAGERSWTIAVGGSGRGPDADADRAHIRSVAEVGADWWVEWVPPASRDEMRTAIVRGPLV